MENYIYKEESSAIIGAAIEVHKILGNHFKEFVYQDALAVEMRARGIPFEKEKDLPVIYKGVKLAHGYRVDFFCYGKILVELKALAEINDENRAQLINYLNVTGYQLGLILNFGKDKLDIARMIQTRPFQVK